MAGLLKRPVLKFNLQLRESYKIERDNQKCFYYMYLYLLVDDGFVSQKMKFHYFSFFSCFVVPIKNQTKYVYGYKLFGRKNHLKYL